jgi:hypothetical protein
MAAIGSFARATALRFSVTWGTDAGGQRACARAAFRVARLESLDYKRPTMKRTFTVVATLGLFGLVACQGGAGEPVKLVPDQASVIAGVDMKGLSGSQAYKDNKATLEKDEEAKQILEAAKACNLDPEQFSSVTFGMDPGSENVVVVIKGAGVGKAENVTCIQGKIKEKVGQDPWTMEEKDGKNVLTIAGGEGTGYLVDDNTVAVASKGWADSVKQLIDGKGKAAVDGGLKELYASCDHGKHIWVHGKIPADAASKLKGTPGEPVKDFCATVDLSTGLAFALRAGTDSEENAKKFQEEAQKQFDQMKGMAGAMGIPQGVVDSVKLAAAGSAVTIDAAVSTEDMKAIQEKLGGMMGGMMGGPPPGPPPGMDMPPPGAPPPGAPPAGDAPPAAPPPGGAPPAAPPPGGAPPAAPPAKAPG